jgi:hypothetical protein
MPDLFANPVHAPHKTKRFWMWGAIGLVPVLLAPLYIWWEGAARPSVRVQVETGVITFAMWIAIFWFGFRFGRIAWLVILPLMFAFVLFAWFHL